MTTDRGRWLPLVPEATEAVIAEHHLYEGEDLIREAAEAQRDADWQVVEPVIALATTMAKALVLFENDGLAPEHTYCLACGHFAEPSGQIEHDTTCPVGWFLALKIRMEAKV